MKNAVKVFKEIGVSVWCSELVTVNFHVNNKHNLDTLRDLFSVSLKSVNMSMKNVFWVWSILVSFRLRAVTESTSCRTGRSLLAPGKACLDG